MVGKVVLNNNGCQISNLYWSGYQLLLRIWSPRRRGEGGREGSTGDGREIKKKKRNRRRKGSDLKTSDNIWDKEAEAMENRL